MKLFSLILIMMTLTSCGRIIENDPPLFYEDGWKRNNQTYSNGKKTSNVAVIGIPYTKLYPEVVTFPVPCWSGEVGRNYCRGGRVLSLDLSKFLSHGYYQVQRCYESGSLCYAEIRFENTRAGAAYFDYQAY